MTKIAVVAVGGNSLIKDEKHKTVADQYDATVETSKHIAGMIEQGWNVVLTHGNGPQVGFILRRSELSIHELHPVPLDYCGADTQGAIGYMFQRALYNEFKQRGIQKQAATIVTQVLVDKHDPAFQSPSKPIGSFMSAEAAARKRSEENWAMVEDAGRGWRRVVPSPLPKAIVERDAIDALIHAEFLVICSGGGGIPVVENEHGELEGVEAVIDKDFAGSLLARSVGADLFLISTAVEKVALNYNKPDQVWLDHLTIDEAKKYLAEGHFHKGSMGPKIQAAIWFLEGGDVVSPGETTSRTTGESGTMRDDASGGREALITDPENLERALEGKTGTRITK
jgi:carbamate kinase